MITLEKVTECLFTTCTTSDRSLHECIKLIHREFGIPVIQIEAAAIIKEYRSTRVNLEVYSKELFDLFKKLAEPPCPWDTQMR